MLFSLRPPLPDLQPHIEMFVYHSGLVMDYRKERLLPDGAMNLISDLSGVLFRRCKHRLVMGTQAQAGLCQA